MAIKSIEITNLTNNQLYGFRMFPRNLKGQYQTRDDKGTATATPKAGIPVSSLPVGTLIKDVNTKYYGVPIVWKIADQNHTGYPTNSTTLISDKILTLKCIDAKEPNNSNSNRRANGNNRYSISNIKQWLNSNASANSWYSAQHSTDNPPNSSNVNNGHNPYEAQVGFINGFSIQFINLLLTTSIIVAKDTVADSGGSEVIQDKIFLASNTETGLTNENNIAEGYKLALFSDNNSRLAKPTQEAVNNTDYKNPYLSINNPYSWWLRTPKTEYSATTNIIKDDGTITYQPCYSGYYGVRPLCNIKNDTLVLPQPDTDGAYIIQF